MKMLFKQRLFAWFDSYDIYDPEGNVLYTVRGQLAWGHCLRIFDPQGRELGTVREKVFSFLPRFQIYLGESFVGSISREFSFMRPRFTIDFRGWQVRGDWMEWNYQVVDQGNNPVAMIHKELWNWTDTYSIEVPCPEDALCALMVVLAIDAEKCSRNS